MVEMPDHNELHDTLETKTIAENVVAIERPTTDIAEEQKLLEKERDKRRRQKRKRFAGYIRSRKFKRRLKVNPTNDVLNSDSVQMIDDSVIPKIEVPYKKFRSATLEILSNNEILESRTRLNRRVSQRFSYDVVSAQPQALPKKKPLPNCVVKHEPISKEKCLQSLSKIKSHTPKITNEIDISIGIRPRQRRRINYSEDLVDEAFMYEQILHDKQMQQEKRKKSITKPLAQPTDDDAMRGKLMPSSANLDSRLRLLEQRNEISITPVKSRMMNTDTVQLGKMPIPMKTEPLFNITSSVSVHIKPRKSIPSTSNLQISNITSLHSKRLAPDMKRRKFTCKHCSVTFADEHQLAMHQAIHLKIMAHKIDSVKVLHPKLRRVSVTISFLRLY